MIEFDSEHVVEGKRTIQAERKSLFPNCFGWYSSSLSIASKHLHNQQKVLNVVVPFHYILKQSLVKNKCV